MQKYTLKFITLSLQLSYTSCVEATIVVHGPLKQPSLRKLQREHALTQVMYSTTY